MVIDQFIIGIMWFLGENGADVPFLFPEICIASTKKPVIFEHENFTTYLTGSVDYALLTTTSEFDQSIGKLRTLSLIWNLLNLHLSQSSVLQQESETFRICLLS